MARRLADPSVSPKPAGAKVTQAPLQPRWPGALKLSCALLLYVSFAELGVELWYGRPESNLPPPLAWTVRVPTNHSGYCSIVIPPSAWQSLRCDAGLKATWKDEDENFWLVNYVRWNPGRPAAHLARLHTPEACLPSTGWKLQNLPGVRRLGSLESALPFRVFHIQDDLGRSGYLFYCRSGDSREYDTEDGDRATRCERLRAIWRGRRLGEMSVLEIAVWGICDEVRAQAAVDRELRQMVVIK